MNDRAPEAAPRSGRRPLILVAVAALIGLLAILSLWAKRQALETENWVETSSALLEDQEISDALATYLVDELYANVDVEAEVAEVLPEPAQPLAGPAASGLRQAGDEIAKRALQSEAIQTLWEQANRNAHELLIEVIEGGGDRVSTEGGTVTLDLSEILAEVAERTGIPGDVASKLPPDAANLEILESEELGAAQDAVDLFKKLVWILVVLTVGLYALAVYIAGDRRRETLRAVGFSMIVVGAIVLIVRSLAGDAVVDSLASDGANEAAVTNAWAIATSLLSEAGSAVILYGLAIVFAAWLAGPTSIATSVRGGLAPYLRQPRIAYGALFVLLVLLFWWNPVPATDRLGPSLLLIALLVLGTEMLRRRTLTEFPDRVTTFSAAGLAQTMASQTRESIASRTSRREQRQQQEATSGRLDALERLAGLRESGLLTEEELEAEKAKIIAATSEKEE